MSKFSYFPRQVKHVPFPLISCYRETQKNILYYQRDVENDMDQVLNFFLFHKHEYKHLESSSL